MRERQPYTSIMVVLTKDAKPLIAELPEAYPEPAVAVSFRDQGVVTCGLRFDTLQVLDRAINALCEARVRLADLRTEQGGVAGE